jgi:riboflavin synthase
VFTGIVEAMGTVSDVARGDMTVRLRVEAAGLAIGSEIGASLAVSGACLTVVGHANGHLEFDVGPETLGATTLGALGRGDQVNLERPLRLGGTLGGHLVLGHVDAVGTVVDLARLGSTARMRIGLPDRELSPLLIPKGSVAVDGVSLTVADLDDKTFEVMVIPHTLAVTTLGRLTTGSRVNLEMDVIGKYLQRSLALGIGPGGSGLGSGAAYGSRTEAQQPRDAWGSGPAHRPRDEGASS